MLQIRKEQYEELGKVSLKRFEDSMVEHIKEYFPKCFEIHKEPLIRKVILYAVDRAESYGLITERDVCLYINLVFLLGSNFDTDPQMPWAAAILNDETITDSVIRIDKLHDKGMEYLDQVAGVENEYLGRALLKVREISIEDFAKIPTGNAGDIAATQLQKIWRRKRQQMGETILARLIRDGIESAKGHNLTSERGVVLYTVLMFFLGSGFDKDPQFPWAENVLNDKSIPDESTRVNRLYEEAIAFMEKWLT
jgi:hypothetical protein